jgi:hypothetical protein
MRKRRIRALFTILFLGACDAPTNVAGEEAEERMNGATRGDRGFAVGEPPLSEAQLSRLSSAEQAYFACVRALASGLGPRHDVSAAQAEATAVQCRHLLGAAAAARVAANHGSRMTNLPDGLETEEVRMSVATADLEHSAKVLVSGNVPMRAIP